MITETFQAHVKASRRCFLVVGNAQIFIKRCTRFTGVVDFSISHRAPSTTVGAEYSCIESEIWPKLVANIPDIEALMQDSSTMTLAVLSRLKLLHTQYPGQVDAISVSMQSELKEIYQAILQQLKATDKTKALVNFRKRIPMSTCSHLALSRKISMPAMPNIGNIRISAMPSPFVEKRYDIRVSIDTLASQAVEVQNLIKEAFLDLQSRGFSFEIVLAGTFIDA